MRLIHEFLRYSNLPHSQDYLAPGNKHATDKIAAELCIHAFYLAMNVAWYVQFQVLNNLENAASLNNLLLREGFQSTSKWKTRTSHLGEQNSTHFIEIRHTKLDKAVCIHAVFSDT